ncbi:cytochrome P450 4C1-like isoform X1 [Spodoptera litura]|uniref:Cytochrome P450 4C1-like isoform X1 n=1 Tax=Spodoptera litura TaxID=69820 RepID=A0A9J7EAX2_SPOLT|nr:cytochrome P450 4C1-like isoform X1 [Spodoptera litura]
MLVVLFGVTAVLLWYWWKRHPRSPPSFPGELPIIGHVFAMLGYRNDIWTFIKRVCDYSLENGGLIRLNVGSHIIYVVSDPNDTGVVASMCLEKGFFYEIGRDFVQKGLLTSDATTWKTHRKLLHPAFNQQVLNTFINEMNVQARNLVSQLTAVAQSGSVDIHQFVIKYVLRIVCRTSLGLEAKDQNIIDNNYANAIQEILKIFCYRGIHPWLYPPFIYKRTAWKKKEDDLIRDLKNMINTVIQKRRFDLKANNFVTNNGVDSITGRFKPVLDLLLHLADGEHAFTDDEIKEHLDTIVIASYDTTSTVLQTILLVLGTYPEVQERVYNEVQEVFQNSEDLSMLDLSKLVYLEAVIKEVLRVYSTVPIVSRKLDTDIVLPNYTLRAGSTCILSIYGLHHHSSWGPDVKEFKPERWLNPDTLPTNPNVYVPFSIGKRNCIGKQYAMMSLKTSLAHIVRKLHVSGDISNMKWKYELVLKPAKPALIEFTIRS